MLLFPNRSARRSLLGVALLATAATAVSSGCRDTTLVPPRSLDSPTAMAVARGGVCLSTFENEERVVQYVIEECETGERGAIGLIVNEQSDRLALLDLSIASPRLVDLDPATPGPNHVRVGRLPVDVAASPDGTTAYTLNQLDRDVSIVDLLTLDVEPARYSVNETPISMEVEPTTGEVVVAAGSPSKLYGFATDVAPEEASARTIDLPGTVSDLVFHPGGDEAWVTYRDRDFATTVSFGETPDGFETACLSGVDEKPCITAHVPLKFGCSDGLDNDGDGLVDQQDIQCFSPLGAESQLGITRSPTAACANGLDDDEDGFTDREDPECVVGSGDEETSPYAETPVATCNDGDDDDDDGDIDYPDDASCFGPLGRVEADIRPLGFDAIGVDTHGVFFYVVDRTGEQVLTIDGRRKQLVDAPASQNPPADAVDGELGVDVAPSPLDVSGAIDRRITWRDPDDEDHVVVRYDFGAWISSNNGALQYVDGVVSFCEFTGEVVTNADFWRLREGDAEAECLDLPTLPLEPASSRAAALDDTLPEDCLTEDFVACAECLEGDEEVCEPCDLFAETQFDLCQRAHVTENVTRYVNPRFGLRDVGGDDGRILGIGTCEQPDELVSAMQEFAADNPSGPQTLQCDSLLMPQPLAPMARLLDADDTVQLSEVSRADLFELRTLQFDGDAGNAPLVGIRPADQRILTEPLTVTYEGTIPGTSRTDGVLPTEALEDGSIWVDVGFNPCSRGVEPGDHLFFTGTPTEDCPVEEDLEYEIVEVTNSEVRIAPIEGLASEVPVRDCFDTAAAYVARVSGEWTVVGDSSGFLSPWTDAFGQCVPRYGADRLGSRVETGETFVGPYYSLYLYPGFAPDEVEPVRGTSFTFQSSSGFESALFATCSSLGQQCAAGLFPTQVLWVPGLPNGTLLLSPDPNDNFIHIRNLDDSAAGFAVVR